MSANLSSNFTSLLADPCMNVIYVFSASKIILLLLFSIIILYLGLQKCRQQHSLKTASHSDFFAYHLVAMELIWVLGWFCELCSYYINVAALELVGQYLTVSVYYGEMLFHVLTCAEQYLAVVHPVIYMGLKNTRGVRIRNISIVCVWVLGFILMKIHMLTIDYKLSGLFCFLAVFLIVTCYCSVSVLCVLISPGPGDRTRNKAPVDQSKQRAFYTIAAISMTICLSFVGNIVGFSLAVNAFNSQTYDEACFMFASVSFFSLPSCLVSPLLYLQRAGKLAFICCRGE